MATSDEELYCNYYIYNLTKTFLQQTSSPSRQPYVAQTLRSDVTLLPASLALNFCLLTSGFVCAFLRREWESPSRRKFFSAEENRKDVSKCFAEHLLTLGLFLVAVYLLCTTQLLYQPFVYCGDKTLIVLAVSVNLGKYVYLTYDVILHRHTEGFVPLVIHHVVTLACYLATAVWGENLLPAVLGLLMDSSTLCLSLKTLLVRAGVPKGTVRLLVARLGGSVSNIVFRGVVPVVFMAIAFIYQSPNIMKPISLAALAMEIVFFSVINIYLIGCSLWSVINVMKYERPAQPVYIFNDINTTETLVQASQTPVTTKPIVPHVKPIANTNVETVQGIVNNRSDSVYNKNTGSKHYVKNNFIASVSQVWHESNLAAVALNSPSGLAPVYNSVRRSAGAGASPGRNNQSFFRSHRRSNVNPATTPNNRPVLATLYTISEESDGNSSVCSGHSDLPAVHLGHQSDSDTCHVGYKENFV